MKVLEDQTNYQLSLSLQTYSFTGGVGGWMWGLVAERVGERLACLFNNKTNLGLAEIKLSSI